MKKVFISSVVKGFENYRAMAKKAVKLVKMEAILVEDLPASPTTPQSACLDEIHKADVVILIMGEKYGSKTPRGISVTEEEYNEAQRLGKPILVFVQEVGMEPEQREFKKKVEGFVDGYLRTTFSTEEKLKDGIIEALSGLNSREIPKRNINKRDFKNEVKAVISKFNMNNDRPRAFIAFQGIPFDELDLDEIEQNKDELFKILCDTGATSLRSGYRSDSYSDEYLMIKTEGANLIYFTKGIIFLDFNSSLDDNESYLANFYVSPEKFISVTQKATKIAMGHFNSALVSVGVHSMSHCLFDRPSNSNSISQPYRNEEEHILIEFFPSLGTTEKEYCQWIEKCASRLRRRFGDNSNQIQGNYFLNMYS